jgi:hypothetical protein
MKELIQKAWSDHKDDPDGVRDRLFQAIRGIETTKDLVDWSKIWAHLVGFELGEPLEALKVLGGLLTDSSPEHGSAYCDAYMLSRLAEHEVSLWSLRLMIAAPRDFAPWNVKAEALLAEHRVDNKDWNGLHALALIAQAAHALPPGSLCERNVAVSLNNGVSSAVEADDLAPQYRELLVGLAGESRNFWKRVGTPLNDARGAYLIQLAANAAGEPARGIQSAYEAIALLEELEDVDIDLTFVRLALAASEKLLGQSDTATLAEADAMAAEWQGGLRDWYENTRRRGFGER